MPPSPPPAQTRRAQDGLEDVYHLHGWRTPRPLWGAATTVVSESRMGRAAALTLDPHAAPVLCNVSARDPSGRGALMGMRYPIFDPQSP